MRLNRESLLVRGREAKAMLLQARYLSRDLLRERRRGTGPTVILVHGIYASAGVFRPLRELLHRSLDATTYVFSYLPGAGILDLSERVSELLHRASEPAPIVLVGHSLGGLVHRAYCQRPDRDSRVVLTVSLAAPFEGARRHSLVPGQGGRDLAPGTPLLSSLRTPSALNLSVAHFAVGAADDSVIFGSPFPDYGERISLNHVGHNGILFDARAHRLVVEHVKKFARFTGNGKIDHK